jgi:hypothetical protein
VPWLGWLVAGLSPRNPGFATRSVHVGFVVGKLALGKGFLRVLRLSPVNMIPLWLHTHHSGMNKSPLVAAVQTQSHPIHINNKVGLISHQQQICGDFILQTQRPILIDIKTLNLFRIWYSRTSRKYHPIKRSFYEI